MQPSDEKWSSLRDDSGGDNALGPRGPEGGPVETEEELWSPPQFSMQSMMLAVTAFCFICAVIKGFGIEWGGGFIRLALLGFVCWFLVGCVRLVRLSRGEPVPRPPQGNPASATKRSVASPEVVDNPEDALATAFRWEMKGDWDAAMALYRDVAIRWPEHRPYAQECIARLEEKRSNA